MQTERTHQSTDASTSQRCPECNGPVVATDTEHVCQACGLVVAEQQIDHGPEWRSFETEQRERTGAPLTTTRHDRGLSTEIGRYTDGAGQPLAGHKRRQLHRLRREQSRGRWQSKAERNLGYGLREIQRLVGALGLGETHAEQAGQLFRQAQQEDLLLGRSIESVATASVYGIVRCRGLARRLDDVVAVAQVDRQAIKTAYDALNRHLGLPTQPPTPRAYVPELASTLEVPPAVRQQAEQVAQRAAADGLITGASPAGFAAGCLYYAVCEQNASITQRAVAEAAGVSPATLRSHWHTLQTAYK